MMMKISGWTIHLLAIIGCAAIALVLLTIVFPQSYSLFEMTNWDTQPHTIHIVVTDDATQAPVYEESIPLSPGQRVERGIPSWDSDKTFNFSVTLDQTISSQFTLNLWRERRGVIDIGDPDAYAKINSCILYHQSGFFDNGNPQSLFSITNSDTNKTHNVTVSVADNSGRTFFEQEFVLAPGQEINSLLKSTITIRQYRITTTVDRNATSTCSAFIGPATANCQMTVNDSGIEGADYSGFTYDYALMYWKGKCSG
ncbi:MAG: hypothetical protein Q7T80_02755 [Methanoregula sp.]|nr:hypothetical protein [Methanoregula sp.]